MVKKIYLSLKSPNQKTRLQGAEMMFIKFIFCALCMEGLFWSLFFKKKYAILDME